MKFSGKVGFCCERLASWGLLFALLGRARLALGQELPGKNLFNPDKIKNTTLSLDKILTSGLTILLTFAGFIAVGFTVYSGILYITSTGDPAKVSKALQSGIYSLVGTIVIALSLLILRVVVGSAGFLK